MRAIQWIHQGRRLQPGYYVAAGLQPWLPKEQLQRQLQHLCQLILFRCPDCSTSCSQKRPVRPVQRGAAPEGREALSIRAQERVPIRSGTKGLQVSCHNNKHYIYNVMVSMFTKNQAK